MNVVQVWLYLIGTPARAQRLLDNLWQLEGLRHRRCGGPIRQRECLRCHHRLPKALIRELNPPPDPVAVLDGEETAQKLYADPAFTTAFDAWDTRQLTLLDMKRFAEWIQAGHYSGPALLAA